MLFSTSLLDTLIACNNNKDRQEIAEPDVSQTEETGETTVDTSDSADTDSADTDIVDSGDTAEPMGAMVAITLYDHLGNLADGIPVKLGEMTGTTSQGLYAFENVATDGLLVLSAYPEQSVDLHTAVFASENTSLEIAMIIPEVQETVLLSDGTEQTISVDGVSVGVGGSVGFTDPSGNPYSGEVKLRIVPDIDPLSQPNPVDLDVAGLPLGCPPILTNFNVTSVSSTGEELQPTETITLRTAISSYDTSQPITLESFNPETGLWQQDALASYENGVVSADVSHFTQFRFVNGAREEQSGMAVSVVDSSGDTPQISELSWSCTDTDGYQETGSYVNMDNFCVMVPKDSTCSVTVNGSTTTDIAVSNSCVCTIDTTACEQVEIDVSEPIACGNGITEENEGCDDGNTLGGDGCDDNCQPENCYIEYHGALNAMTQYFVSPAICTFGYLTNPNHVDGLAIYDGFINPSSFDPEASSDWTTYASNGGTILGLMQFDPSYIIGNANAVHLAQPMVLGHAAVGTLAFSENNTDVTINEADTTNMTFDMTMDIYLEAAASSYPPPANDPTTGSFFDLGAVSDPISIHVWGKYTIIPMQ